MFERYTETARRALFFARYEASQVGSPTITIEMLLLGIIRADRQLVAHLLAAGTSPDDIRRDIEERIRGKEKISTSIEIPFEDATKSALQYAAEESDRLLHRHIGTEHLLLGVLREEHSGAAAVLMKRGMQMATAREAVARLSANTQVREPFHALNNALDRLSTVAASQAEAVQLINEIRERVAALERQLGDHSE